jgi:hypothetical protein
MGGMMLKQPGQERIEFEKELRKLIEKYEAELEFFVRLKSGEKVYIEDVFKSSFSD